MLFVPIPSGLLDFLILTNVSFALLILLLTFYIARPVEFSTFPSLLLIATLFREVDFDGYVPEKLYPQIAKIMVWVYAMREARSNQQR